MKNSLLLKFLLLLLFLVSMVFLGLYFDVGNMLTLEYIRLTIESSSYAPFLFVGIYILSTFVFLPSTPLTIVAGFLFGTFLGTVYVVVASLISSIIAFTLARFLGEEFVSKILKDKFPKLEAYNGRLVKNGFLTVLILRFIPIFPLNGLNMALGVTKISSKDFFLATCLGIVPGSLIYAYFGNSIGVMNIVQIIFSIILIVFITIIAIWYTHMTHTNAKNKYDVIDSPSMNIDHTLNEQGLKVLFIEKIKKSVFLKKYFKVFFFPKKRD